MTIRAIKPWTAAETDLALAKMAELGNYESVAKLLGRTPVAVKHHLYARRERLGLCKRAPKDVRAATADLQPHPGVERCPRCLLMLPHAVCLARNVTEHVEMHMRRASR